jgi:hypothetical protein
MAKEFPELRLCENGWKADHIATEAYSGFGNKGVKDKVKKESNPKQESTALDVTTPLDATPLDVTAPLDATPLDVTPLDVTPINVTAPLDATPLDATAPLDVTVSSPHKRKPSFVLGQDTIKKARVASTIDSDDQENAPIDNTGNYHVLFRQHTHALDREFQRGFYPEYSKCSYNQDCPS